MPNGQQYGEVEQTISSIPETIDESTNWGWSNKITRGFIYGAILGFVAGVIIDRLLGIPRSNLYEWGAHWWPTYDIEEERYEYGSF